MLHESNATVLSAGHVDVFGEDPIVMLGTDFGLIGWNTTDGQEDSSSPWWIFDRITAEDYVTENI